MSQSVTEIATSAINGLTKNGGANFLALVLLNVVVLGLLFWFIANWQEDRSKGVAQLLAANRDLLTSCIALENQAATQPVIRP